MNVPEDYEDPSWRDSSYGNHGHWTDLANKELQRIWVTLEVHERMIIAAVLESAVSSLKYAREG